jgi:hypothetical protein
MRKGRQIQKRVGKKRISSEKKGILFFIILAPVTFRKSSLGKN